LGRALADAGLDPDGVQVMPPSRRPHGGRKEAWSPLVVALGAATAEIMLGRGVRLALERGRITALGEGVRLLITESPAAILRLSDAVARGREYRRLVNDLLLAVPYRRRAC
jgi:hypothetical protein